MNDRKPRPHRRVPPADESGAAWLITFTDMILLLLAYFVFLFTILSVDDFRLKRALESFRSYLSQKPVEAQVRRASVASLYADPTGPIPVSMEKDEAEEKTKFKTIQEGTKILGRVMRFAPGSPELTPAMRELLRQFTADSLRGRPNRVEVRGHATPGEAADPWELSWRRAQTVAAFFQELGIDRRRLRLCGCGDVQPHRVAPDTPPREAAAADRRVEIVDTGEYVR